MVMRTGRHGGALQMWASTRFKEANLPQVRVVSKETTRLLKIVLRMISALDFSAFACFKARQTAEPIRLERGVR